MTTELTCAVFHTESVYADKMRQDELRHIIHAVLWQAVEDDAVMRRNSVLQDSRAVRS